MARLKVLIVSRSKAAADHLRKSLSGHPEFVANTRIMGNGHADPLNGISEKPDVLLLHHAPGQGELPYLVENSQRDQIPLVVCGPGDDPEAMRLAMQAGSRDYVAEDAPAADLVASLLRIQEEKFRTGGSAAGQLIVVMNGKGGSGASFLATNLAYSLVVDAAKRVTLADLDIQFGGLSRYLDITPEVGILQALEVAKQMDDVSADAYTSEHSSGLRLLAAPSDGLVPPNEIPIEALDALLDVFLSINDFVVVDAPNRLDTVTELVLQRADKIVLVVQQSLPHVQDAARMLRLLTSEIAVPKQRIDVVVNRFSKNALIELGDIRKVLRQGELLTVPNNYKLAAESINSGVPVAKISKNAPLTKGIRDLQATFVNQDSEPAQNFLARALPGILRS